MRWVDTDAGVARCILAGREGAPPVVLLPGWGCTGFTFRHNLPALAAAGYRVVLIEPPGQGWSDKPRSARRYTLPALADAVLQVMEALALPPAAMIGHSLGAGIAMRVALLRPARVTRLALWSPIGFGCAWIVRAGRVLPPALAPLLRRLVRPFLVRLALSLVYGRGHAPSAAVVRQYAAPVRVRGFVRSQIQLLRAVAWTPLPDADRRRLTTPVWILGGDGDPIIPWRCLADAVATLPDARVDILPRVGHAANETHATEVNERTIAFLRGEVPGATR